MLRVSKTSQKGHFSSAPGISIPSAKPIIDTRRTGLSKSVRDVQKFENASHFANPTTLDGKVTLIHSHVPSYPSYYKHQSNRYTHFGT